MRVNLRHDLQLAISALERSQAIGVPGPLPLPYVVAARQAKVINALKHRPSAQPVTIIVDTLERMSDAIDADRRTLALASWLSSQHLIHLQMTAASTVPDWAAGAVSNGILGVSLAWRSDLTPLLGKEGYIYASSANLTGETPASTAAQLEIALGTELTMLQDDPVLPGQSEARSGVIVRIDKKAHVGLVRAGVQNERTGESGETYLSRLYAEWERRCP